MMGRAIPLGRLAEALDKMPDKDRLATRRASELWDSDYVVKRWASREAMARCIRKQQRRPWMSTDWRAVVPLSDGEGY